MPWHSQLGEFRHLLVYPDAWRRQKLVDTKWWTFQYSKCWGVQYPDGLLNIFWSKSSLWNLCTPIHCSRQDKLKVFNTQIPYVWLQFMIVPPRNRSTVCPLRYTYTCTAKVIQQQISFIRLSISTIASVNSPGPRPLYSKSCIKNVFSSIACSSPLVWCCNVGNLPKYTGWLAGWGATDWWWQVIPTDNYPKYKCDFPATQKL